MRTTTTAMTVLTTLALGACGSPDSAGLAEASDASVLKAGPNGAALFNAETFDGNGRKCSTCHLPASGSIAPDDVAALWDADPDHPLFRAIDSDDGVGSDFSRLIADATFRVVLDLPDHVVMDGDPSLRQVVVHRGASSTLNNPAFEDTFMQDGRNLSLQEQALGAVNAHYEPGSQPTLEALDAIAAFQQTNGRFFSSDALKAAATAGVAPTLPAGTTPEEIRGAVWFDDSRPEGVCAHCHGGPFLNETSPFLLAPVPPGSRFFTAFVSEFNVAGNEVHTFAFFDPADPSAPPVVVDSPDPGRALISGNPLDANSFRIPTVWGAKHSAPYFHDNSAPDLQALMDHYQAYFGIIGIPMSEQDKADIIAYMNLLE